MPKMLRFGVRFLEYFERFTSTVVMRCISPNIINIGMHAVGVNRWGDPRIRLGRAMSRRIPRSFGAAVNAFYVWGFDRGAGAEKFNTGANPIGAGMTFDTVVIFRLDGTATIGSTVLHDVQWSGNTITGSVPDSLLPSQGLAFADYGWNLWPRDGTASGNAAISDFAPDASDGKVSAVPEPASIAFFGAGLGLLAAAARRRRQG